MSILNNSLLLGADAGAAGGYEISRSVRFNSSDSAYLSRTPASAGSSNRFTFGGWLKLSKIPAALTSIIGGGASGIEFVIGFNSSAQFFMQEISSGGSITHYNVTTTAVFRDPSSWYHLTVVLDTTEATGSNRIKLWINGTSVQLNFNTTPSLNYSTLFADATYKRGIGAISANHTNYAYLDGYLADIHFIDGQALDPTSFGEFDTNGVWQPKAFSGGSYGTNGFRLPFSDNSTAAALGTDTSSNGNTWTVNNLSIGGIVYSSYGSGTVSGTKTFDKAFDGSTSTFCEPADNQTITFDFTSLPGGGIAVSSSLRMYLNKAGTPAAADFTVNGTNLGGSLPSGNWLTIGGVSSLQTITFFHNSGTSSVELYAVEVDGTTLVDSSPAAIDSLVDSPVNGSQVDTGVGGEVVGNYCTLNPLDTKSTITLSNGSLDFTCSSSGAQSSRATITTASGKWYWECDVNSNTIAGLMLLTEETNLNNPGDTAASFGYYGTTGAYGFLAGTPSTAATFTTGDIIGFAWDADANTIKGYKNNALQFTYSLTAGKSYVPAVGRRDGGGTANFGQRQWAYAAPAGFKALCTTNLPTPTIADGSTAMDVVTYTGNGSTQTISGLNFSPDLVWIKSRSNTQDHYVFDFIRDSGILRTNTTGAETTGTDYIDYNSDGFVSKNGLSSNGYTYVAWTWDAGSSTVTNTDGSISSQVRANASAGFSVVTYTGTGSNATVGHGLGVAPKFVFGRNRIDTGSWIAWHVGMNGGTKYIYLNSTMAVDTYSPFFTAEPTSTVINVGDSQNTNGTGDAMIMYCFAPVAGYSSAFTWSGTGSTDGPAIYLGFRPKLIIWKRTDSAANWAILDSSRSSYNVADDWLGPNSSSSEAADNAAYAMDFLSNGLKIRATHEATNQSGGTYVGFAWAESPFQYARAR